MSEGLATVLLAVALGLLAGALLPVVLRRLPEPELEPEPEAAPDGGSSLTIRQAHEKIPYADLSSRAARVGCAVVVAAATLLLADRLDSGTDLLLVLLALPTGTWLGYIDLRTTFLPTVLIYPTLLVTAVAAVAVAVGSESWADTERAAIGLALYGGLFYLMWFIRAGFGFGDVRLALLLGLVLGFLGWYELVTGFMLALVLGGLGGVVLVLLRLADHRRAPYGPWMLLGALVAAAYGPALANLLGY